MAKMDFSVIAKAQKQKAQAPAPEPARAEPLAEKKDRPPSRRGTKHIGGHFDPAVLRQLRDIASAKDTSIQVLLGQALNMLFHAEGKPTIAREEPYEKG